MSAGGGAGLTGPDNMTPEVNTSACKKAMTWFGGLFSSGISPRGVPFAIPAQPFLSSPSQALWCVVVMAS